MLGTRAGAGHKRGFSTGARIAIMDSIELSVGDYVLKLAPASGGAVAAFA
jgi:hypothetical protein